MYAAKITLAPFLVMEYSFFSNYFKHKVQKAKKSFVPREGTYWKQTVSRKQRKSLFTLQMKLQLDSHVRGHSQNHKISLPQHDFHDFSGTGLHSLNPRVKFEGDGGWGDNPPS